MMIHTCAVAAWYKSHDTVSVRRAHRQTNSGVYANVYSLLSLLSSTLIQQRQTHDPALCCGPDAGPVLGIGNIGGLQERHMLEGARLQAIKKFKKELSKVNNSNNLQLGCSSRWKTDVLQVMLTLGNCEKWHSSVSKVLTPPRSSPAEDWVLLQPDYVIHNEFVILSSSRRHHVSAWKQTAECSKCRTQKIRVQAGSWFSASCDVTGWWWWSYWGVWCQFILFIMDGWL